MDKPLLGDKFKDVLAWAFVLIMIGTMPYAPNSEHLDCKEALNLGRASRLEREAINVDNAAEAAKAEDVES